MLTPTDITHYMGQFMVLVLILTLLPVTVAALVGLVVGLLQGMTQIQDQTLPFALRLIAVFVTLLAAGPWMANELHTYTTQCFDLIIQAGTGR